MAKLFTEEQKRRLSRLMSVMQKGDIRYVLDLEDRFDEAVATLKAQNRGQDGYTPKVGVDFYTPEDKEAMKMEIFDLIPKPLSDSRLIDEAVSRIVAKIKRPKDGRDAVVDYARVIGQCMEAIRAEMPEQMEHECDDLEADEVIESLKSVQEEEDKLPFDAIRDGRALADEVRKLREDFIKNKRTGYVTGGQGTPGIELFVDGVSKGFQRYVNFIAGSGISLTYTPSNGRNDLTISAAAGGDPEAPTSGDIDGSNLVFTFTRPPKVLVVDEARTITINNGFTVDGTGLIATLTLAPNFKLISI